MGGAVERKAATVSNSEIGLVREDGANVLCAGAAGQRGGQFHFEMDEQSTWRMHANPNVPKEPTPRPVTPA